MKKWALMMLLWLAAVATGFSQTNGVPSAPAEASASKDPSVIPHIEAKPDDRKDVVRYTAAAAIIPLSDVK